MIDVDFELLVNELMFPVDFRDYVSKQRECFDIFVRRLKNLSK